MRSEFTGRVSGSWRIALVVLSAAGPVLGQARLPNSSKECAICHVRWIGAFDRSGLKKVMEDVTDRKAGSGDMCLSCHDGSVVDSRFKVWSTHHHTTGQRPSPRVRIPADRFPLNEQGHMTCATCHTAHAVPDDSDMRTVVFLRQPNVDSSLCLACHPEHAQKGPRMHRLGPVDTPVPQVILDAGGQAGVDGKVLMCQTCHEPHGARNAWMLVLPPSELCTACHTSKQPDAAPAQMMPTHHIGQTYPGFHPPASLLEEKATFGRNGELTCLSCHRLHDASGAWPLLIRKNQDSALCLDCHEQETRIIGSPHDLRLSSPDTVNAKGETPSQSGPCGSCHRIHGWARKVTGVQRPHSAGCMECHNPGGPGSRRRPYVEAHPVGVPLPSGVEVSLPVDPESGRIGCLTCHDPHSPRPVEESPARSTSDPDTRAASPPDARGLQAPRSFLREEGSALCLLCHEDHAPDGPSPHDPESFPPRIRESLGLHPSRGSCGVCHATHNAQGPHLWARPRATGRGSPDSDLCGACHDGELAVGPGNTHHPLSASGRPDEPSSDALASPEATGYAVDCATCHDPHGGSSLSFLNANGEFCLACHEDKKDFPGAVHDPVANGWSQKIGFTSKGLCVDCHPIHGPRDEQGVWSSVAAPPDVVGRCEACHRESGPAKAVATPHLKEKLPENMESPLFGVVALDEDQIRCVTCHDIHRNTGDPKILRGGRQNSGVCLACHPETVRLLGSSHDPRKWESPECNVKGEPDAATGLCGACHVAHPVPGRGSWARSSPPWDNLNGTRCSACHPEGSVPEGHAGQFTDLSGDRSSPAAHPESPGAPSPSEPTGTITGVRFTCLTCHDPHAGAPPRDEAHRRQGDRKRKLTHIDKFLRPAVREKICLRCHDREIELADGKKLQNIARVLAESKLHHGPIQEGDCVACHNVHTSTYRRRLVNGYTESFYRNFGTEEFALCFSCHEKGLAVHAETWTDTKFRDGQRNLHFAHVNRKVKGRTCRVCHDNHAGNLPKLLHESVPFGPMNWQLPMNYEETKNGGTCAPGCHKQKSYSRDSDRSQEGPEVSKEPPTAVGQ